MPYQAQQHGYKLEAKKHKPSEAKAYERRRGNASKRGYGHKWRKERARYLRDNPYCCIDSCHALATVVDHIEPHQGDQKLFWRRSNWQPMCKHHHDSKTAGENRGFGNPSRGGRVRSL